VIDRRDAEPAPGFSRARWGFLAIAVVAVVAVAFAGYHLYRYAEGPSESGSPDSPPVLLTAGADAGYVDGALCAECHRAIHETYRHTGMGRSLAHPGPDSMGGDLEAPVRFYHQTSDRHYTIYRKDGRYYQRRHQTGFDGTETNVVEKEIHLVLGSGNHARTFLHRSPDGRIFELPVAWYAEKGGYWAMNPSYDHANHPGFRREILQECLFCHTGYPEIAPGSDMTGSEPRFPGRIPEGIDCQRCHGPGHEHIQAVSRGDTEAIRQSILNPASLSAEAQLELCMQCHLQTTSLRLPHAILRLERGAFSYRPGQPLSSYILHFDHAPQTGYDDKFEIAHQAYRLRKSACFLESGGELKCTTCHDPHEAPRGEAALERYGRICNGCHAAQVEKQVAGGRHPASRNCVGCHMPERRADDVVHVVMTDHYIQRRKPARDLLAPLEERRYTPQTAYHGAVVPYYPGQLPPSEESELYLAVAQVKQFSNLDDGIPKLEAALDKYRPQHGEFYFELAEAYAEKGQLDQAIRRYQDAVTRKPDFRAAWAGLGRALSKAGQHDRAADALRKGLSLGARDATLLNDLGLVLLRQGKLTDAIATFRQAIATDSDLAAAHGNLGGALAQRGDRRGAEQSYREAIRLQPDFAGAHRNLANLLAGQGDLRQAEHHLRKALYHDPGYAEAHYDFALLLAGLERYGEARAQFQAAVNLNPAMAPAQAGLADMLALEGLAGQAIQHYERALAIDADMGAARLGLGSALASQGRLAAALPHLEIAARSADPAVRETAREALQTLRSAPLPGR
jgi:predicted CXXCH cytochrome family protein